MVSVRSCFVALGSNLGDSLRILSQSLSHVAAALNGRVVGCSRLYKSPAELFVHQADFLNAVIQVELPDHLKNHCAPPIEILQRLKAVEAKYSKNKFRYGPRELDLDIIGFSDNLNVDHHEPDNLWLRIPHERSHEREFVLRPLCDIPAGRQILLGPAPGVTAEQFLADLNNREPQKAFPLRNAIFSGKKSWPECINETDENALIMGILNVTPDSFSDGGIHNASVEDAVSHALELSAKVCRLSYPFFLLLTYMFDEQGADVIDVGGESTRPYSDPVTIEEELGRVIPVIEALANIQDFPCGISIDTRKPVVARAAILAGADIINDQAGEMDESLGMVAVASEMGTPIITMHTRGESKTMESLILESSDVSFDSTDYVFDWLENRVHNGLKKFNLPRWNAMVDPGLGFAKTEQQSLKIITRMGEFTGPGHYPVLLGPSRKRFVRSMTRHDIDVASSAVCMATALSGVAMVRVHNVERTRDALNVSNAIRQTRRSLNIAKVDRLT